MIIKAILLGLIAFFGKCDLATGTNMIQRPIVLGPLVGLVMGDLQAGITIGATLELFFLGAVSVGAYIPPNVIVGGVLGTAFAISTGQGTEAAITLAMPIALIAQAIDNLLFSVVRPLLAQVADRCAAKGNARGVCIIHLCTGFLTCTVLFLLTFLGFAIGSGAMESFLKLIPEVVTKGLGIATGLLPALGFAMLARMIMSKNVIPYFFLGFVLSAYFKVPVVGIAIIGLIIIFASVDFKPKAQAQAVNTVEVDDDDF